MHFKTQIYRLWTIVRQFVQSIGNCVRTRLRKEPNIILIGTPEHGNMGDQLIALGELRWLRDYYPQVPIREFTHDSILQDHHYRVLLSQIRKEDILFLHGGGNLNDKYMKCEMIRRFIIQKKTHNKIILFPQSISYAHTKAAQKIKQDTSAVYTMHPDFTILAREQQSFIHAQEMFPTLRTMLVPDIATYLFKTMAPSATFSRDGIALCLRVDDEKYYDKNQLEALREKLSESYNVCITDTHIHRRVLPDQRVSCAQSLIDFMSTKKLIITDRFHGVIFSVLSRTPCIALRSCDHKIIDGVKWFKDLPGVFYAENTEEVFRLVENAYALGEQPQADFSRFFEQLYRDLHLNIER